MSDKLVGLFPTTLLVTKYEEDFKKEFKYIRQLEYEKQQITGVFRSTDSYLMKHPELSKLKEFFLEGLDKYTASILGTDKKLWIVSKISKHKERPQLGRSIVHFINGSIDEYVNGDEVPVKNNIAYNPKKNKIEFFPKILRSPELEIRVDRFYGDNLKKKTDLDVSKRYYDISRD